MPSHYLNQCWNVVNLTLKNKFWWNINQNLHIFIHENAFENVVCEMLAILSQAQWINELRQSKVHLRPDLKIDNIVGNLTQIYLHCLPQISPFVHWAKYFDFNFCHVKINGKPQVFIYKYLFIYMFINVVHKQKILSPVPHSQTCHWQLCFQKCITMQSATPKSSDNQL